MADGEQQFTIEEECRAVLSLARGTHEACLGLIDDLQKLMEQGAEIHQTLIALSARAVEQEEWAAELIERIENDKG